MINERQLNDEVMMDRRWGHQTQNIFNNQLDPDEISDQEAMRIADLVILGRVSVEAVHANADYYNELDRKAIEAAGGDIENFRDYGDIADYIEANAIRLAHHAYRAAYRRIKTYDGRFLHRIDYEKRMRVL
ncbi:MAG TPA: hypothetical protein VH234_04745 [Candidatus Saccharimonadales bacterium]|jgi:hypothetical protein|nr:hypothetical protein [Candidatus Saccharimonadales bacterium]